MAAVAKGHLEREVGVEASAVGRGQRGGARPVQWGEASAVGRGQRGGASRRAAHQGAAANPCRLPHRCHTLYVLPPAAIAMS